MGVCVCSPERERERGNERHREREKGEKEIAINTLRPAWDCLRDETSGNVCCQHDGYIHHPL